MKVLFVPKTHGRAGTPPFAHKNVFVEDVPGIGPVPMPRPGLVAGSVVGTGPVKIVTWFLGDQYILSGQTVYMNGASVGTVLAGGFYQSAQSESELVIVSGWKAYLIVAGVMTEIDTPEQVSGVVFLQGRFIYPNRDSSQFHYSDVGQASSIDALSFENAEKNPDPIVRAEKLGDTVWFFGTRSVEPQYSTGDPDTPLIRSSGQGYDKGCPSPYSIVGIDNALLFVGSEYEIGPRVFRSGAIPQIVSDPTIDAKLTRCSNLEALTALAVIVDGRSFYVMNIPGEGSWALDLSNNLWAEWESFGKANFRLQCGDKGQYGDSATGQLWSLSSGVYTDGPDPLVREATVWLAASRSTNETAVRLEGAYGDGLSTGQGSEPVVSMRWSNGGRGDWSSWQDASIGQTGERSVRAVWSQQGMVTPPGRSLQFRWSDPVLTVPYYVLTGADAYG